MNIRINPVTLAVLAIGIAIGGFQSNRASTLTLIGSPLSEHDLAVLSDAQATFTTAPDGRLTLVADEHAAVALFRLRREYLSAADVCRENVANAGSHERGWDGHNYRRQFLVMLPDGTSSLHSVAKFRYVYDPNSPYAEKRGEHKGYVEMPDIRIESEEQNLHAFNQSADLYERALRRVERLDRHLLAWHTPTIPLED